MQHVWVIDTSGIAEIRRKLNVQDRKVVFERLTVLVTDGKLKFPRQLLDEVERGALKNDYDHAWHWVKNNVEHCKGHEPLDSYVKAVLENKQVARVLDPGKDHEEADPYILALAVKLKEAGELAGVITEDVRTRPTKLSLKDACGLLRIVSVSVFPYLEQDGIWPG